MDIHQYIESLARHEWDKAMDWTKDNPRERIKVAAGVALNWLGDYVGSEEMRWQEQTIAIDNVRFTGTSVEWNEILIDKCQRLPEKFREMVATDPEIATQFAAVRPSDLSILLRRGDQQDTYKVLDGMPALLRAILDGRSTIKAFIPINEDKVLPSCEAHVVYDLIRGCERHARTEEGFRRLQQALVLLCQSYANVPDLLRERFNVERIKDEQINQVIAASLAEFDRLSA
jgi:hypothetical protein